MVTPPTAEQVERNERGVAACRAVLAAAAVRRTVEVEQVRPLTRSDEIHVAARAKAARLRRTLKEKP